MFGSGAPRTPAWRGAPREPSETHCSWPGRGSPICRTNVSAHGAATTRTDGRRASLRERTSPTKSPSYPVIPMRTRVWVAGKDPKIIPSLTPAFQRLQLSCEASSCYKRHRSTRHPGPRGQGPRKGPPTPPYPGGAALALQVEEEPAGERPRPRLPEKLVPRGRQQDPAATSASRRPSTPPATVVVPGTRRAFKNARASPAAAANYGVARRTKLVVSVLLSGLS